MSKRTMKVIDEVCLTPMEDIAPERIREIRLQEHASRAVFARYAPRLLALASSLPSFQRPAQEIYVRVGDLVTEPVVGGPRAGGAKPAQHLRRDAEDRRRFIRGEEFPAVPLGRPFGIRVSVGHSGCLAALAFALAEPGIDVDARARAADASVLLDALIARVPARLPIRAEPVRTVTGPGRDLFGNAVAPPRTTRKPPAQATAKPAHDWGPVSELAVETGNAPSNADTPAAVSTAGPYEAWRPGVVRIPGAVEHPTPLVQSAAMAAVPHPTPAHCPLLPGRVVTDGLLSDAQLESVVLAGEAHSRHLAADYRIGSGWETVQRCGEGDDAHDTESVTADGEALSAPVRFLRGWMLGDGTGAGKGLQVAAIVLDNWLRGRRRALWLSQSDKLVEDARRDWTALGGHEDDVFPISSFRQGADIPLAEGILFATYATLRSPARQGKQSRLDQIVEWLAGGMEEDDRHALSGVIVFDEAHAMANAAGSKGNRGEVKPSQQGRAGLRLQNALPDARIAYVSATGATTVPGLAYAGRLGLWAAGDTPFEIRTDFVSAMEAGGVAAMEVVARDLKALGLYQARALSYAGAFKVIHKNIEEALKATGIVDDESTLNRNAKSAAMSAFPRGRASESALRSAFYQKTGLQCSHRLAHRLAKLASERFSADLDMDCA